MKRRDKQIQHRYTDTDSPTNKWAEFRSDSINIHTGPKTSDLEFNTNTHSLT